MTYTLIKFDVQTRKEIEEKKITFDEACQLYFDRENDGKPCLLLEDELEAWLKNNFFEDDIECECFHNYLVEIEKSL